MDQALYYLGPEHTWSHAAALRAKRVVPAVADARLIPSPSADSLFDKILSEPNAAVIIPTYNLEQGIVYDFSRFQLFEEIGSLELKTRMCLFGRVQTMSALKRIYTKDTVLPQVSDWLHALPDHIEIIARPDISTARGVALAAAEPDGLAGAICSEAAGRAHDLRPLALGIANNSENYTAFSLFKKGGYFAPSAWLATPPEYSFSFGPDGAKRAAEGRLNVLWHITAEHNRSLHIGHLSAILTLRRLASAGNNIIVQVEQGPFFADLCQQLREALAGCRITLIEAAQRETIFRPEAIPAPMRAVLDARADIRGCERVPGRSEHRMRLLCNHQLFLHAVARTSADLVVAGPSLLPDLKMIAQHMGQIVPTILVDYLPGTDSYAKMSAERDNHIDWTTSLDQVLSLPKKMLGRHFSPRRTT